ncbi:MULTISPECIES: hypothetical protein [unclassified Streptomyces]|uniref:hypothetical protein n=1 Tax=unclassified Streptomyces TaxID=2593676 RepID=UPI003316B2A9
MPKYESEFGPLFDSILEVAFRPENRLAQTDTRRKAEQMISLLNKGDRTGAERLAGTWTDAERRAVQAELGRL